ncbi:homeobox-leucine zipper protein HAT22-like protein [Tanacetum coccineum]
MGFRLDLALSVHPKVEVTNHGDCDHKHDEEKYDKDSCSCKNIDDLEEKENRGTKRSDSSNLDVYHDNSGGSRKKLKLTIEQITLHEDRFKIQSTLNTGRGFCGMSENATPKQWQHDGACKYVFEVKVHDQVSENVKTDVLSFSQTHKMLNLIQVGYDKQGLPIGLQLIVRPWGEATILRPAAAIEVTN